MRVVGGSMNGKVVSFVGPTMRVAVRLNAPRLVRGESPGPPSTPSYREERYVATRLSGGECVYVEEDRLALIDASETRPW